MKSRSIHLIHGKGGSPDGSVLLLEATLLHQVPDHRVIRQRYPHSDPNVSAEISAAWMLEQDIEQDALVVGISLGGLVAACVQETARPDLTVVCLSSPTWADKLCLKTKPEHRWSFYSSEDEVIAGRTDWLGLSRSFDLPFITHDTDKHLRFFAGVISAIAKGDDTTPIIMEALAAWGDETYEEWRLA